MSEKTKLAILDPEELLLEMFDMGPDFSAIVELLPVMYGLEDTRALFEELEWQNSIRSKVLAMIAVSTLGQYSLMRKTPAIGLFRIDGYFREAFAEEEAQSDFEHFGEQVMGEEIKPEDLASEYRPLIEFFKKKYHYTGPARLERVLCALKVVPNETPTKELVANLLEQVDAFFEPADTARERMTDCYFFIKADKGKVEIGGFKKLDELNLENLQFLGELEMVKEKLLFYPGGEREDPLDYSECIYD
jgi:hypothetical protein